MPETLPAFRWPAPRCVAKSDQANRADQGWSSDCVTLCLSLCVCVLGSMGAVCSVGLRVRAVALKSRLWLVLL